MVVKIRGFPASHKVKLFRVMFSTKRTDYIVTNDMAQDDTQAVKEVCSFRWKAPSRNQIIDWAGRLSMSQSENRRNHVACVLFWFGFA